MTAPDAKWIPFLKLVFGFMLLMVLAGISAVIAIAKVEQATSYGLEIILGAVAVLSGQFAQWCFGAARDEKDSIREKDNEKDRRT